MLKKVGRRVCRVASNIIPKKQQQNRQQRPPQGPQQPFPPSSPQPSSSPPSTMPLHHHHNHRRRHDDGPFVFPTASSSVVPDPSRFFAPHLLSSPLPTNSFFQNFVLKNGDQPEYIHPYLVKSSAGAVTVCYPTRFAALLFIYQTFVADLTISSTSSAPYSICAATGGDHKISAFDDLSVTLDLPNSLRFYLVRGSPFLTAATLAPSRISISTVHAILSFESNSASTKYTIQLNNGQTWLVYSSSPLRLIKSDLSNIASDANFSGVLRIAVLPNPSYEQTLDRFSACYATSGNAVFSRPFTLEYRWEKIGWGDLLLLAHPLHLRLLDVSCGVTLLPDLKYHSIDGDLVGVVGHSWLLKTDPISLTWHSIKGLNQQGLQEVVSALTKDVNDLKSSTITTSSSYFYGKAVARAARLALIAEEVGFTDVIPSISQFLKNSVSPWLDGSFNGNGFLYDPKWGGLLTKQGSTDTGADFGFGIYNDHHFHLGYFLYAIAVLSRVDPAWGRKFKPQAYSLMADFMTLGRRQDASYTRLRCFDLWKLHSWAGGLTEFADGRNQESTSEAINAYYSAALMGLSYSDTHLVAMGSTLTAFEIQAAVTWWHVREGEGMYEDDFSRENRLVGVLWNSKRDSGLWFAPAEWKEQRLGIQVLPLLPITEILFKDVDFVRNLIKWVLPALTREGVTDGWRGFVYALQGVYDKETALDKTRALKEFDDGNSLSNLLWWLHSRGDDEDGGLGWASSSWYHHYCH